jgi:O-acetyl-ADP-ribose deacetylase (regulator of RNase III)
MSIINGNLIELAKGNYFDLIFHGCNCFSTMNSGIAKQIKIAFPMAYIIDKQCKKSPIEKLGSITYTIIKIPDKKPLIIVNAYTQFKYGRDKSYIDYDALRSCLKIIKTTFPNKKIGYPKIGSGLAGGDWDKIYSIILEEFEGLDHTLVIYDN